jgi:CO dehydrogenase nickel-insertion accessory protein CooC1
MTDFTPIGLETAERILDLSEEMDIEINDVFLVVNRITQEQRDHPKLEELKKSGKYSEIFYIPTDNKLLDHVFEGKSILDLPDNYIAVKTINEISKSASVL